MYKETLKILMEGISCPIKEQILKNQLQYHFKNKNKDNQCAIDNTVVIVRQLLEKFSLMDLIEVQPIAPFTDKCKTIPNIDDDVVETNSYNMQLHTVEPHSELESERNHVIASEIEYKITGEIIDEMLSLAPAAFDINIDFSRTHNLTRDIMDAVDEIDAQWMIVGMMESAILKTDQNLTHDIPKASISMGAIVHIGKINDVDIYSSLLIDDTIIVGSSDGVYPPITWAPETVLKLGDQSIGDKGEDRFKLLNCSEIFVDIEAVEQRYRKMKIKYK